MPLVTKGPFYIDSFDVGADDFGDSPYADIVVGHPDGFKIIIKIRCPYNGKHTETIYTEW